MILQAAKANPFAEAFTKMATQVDDMHGRVGWVLLLCVVGLLLVAADLGAGLYFARKKSGWVKDMVDIASEYAGIANRQKDRTVRAGEQAEEAGKQVSRVGVGAAKVAKRAADKADEATRRLEDALGAMDDRISAVAGEVRQVRAEVHDELAALAERFDGLIRELHGRGAGA